MSECHSFGSQRLLVSLLKSDHSSKSTQLGTGEGEDAHQKGDGGVLEKVVTILRQCGMYSCRFHVFSRKT